MIMLYSGTPGSGKSLHQARIMWNRLQAGKPVIANYEINTGMIKKCRGEFIYKNTFELDPAFLKEYSNAYFKDHKFREGELWLFIDEAQLIFNSRDWSIKGRREWLEFFTQHRKYGYDVFLIAQFDRMLDRQIRSLIEYEFIHRKVSNYGIKGKLISLVCGWNLFVCVKVWYPMKEKVGSEFFKYRKRLAEIYDSYKDFSDYEKSEEKGKKDAAAASPSPPIDAVTTDTGVKFYEVS